MNKKNIAVIGAGNAKEPILKIAEDAMKKAFEALVS